MHWKKLLLMAIASFAAMYALMYMMVDRYGDVYANLNQLYMTLVMTAAMVLIEVAIMGPMYAKKVVAIAIILSAIVGSASWYFLRNQTAITDKQFLESMIPHHGAALLMCKQNTSLQDPEIMTLCEGIIANQQSEIDWMQKKLATFN